MGEDAPDHAESSPQNKKAEGAAAPPKSDGSTAKAVPMLAPIKSFRFVFRLNITTIPKRVSKGPLMAIAPNGKICPIRDGVPVLGSFTPIHETRRQIAGMGQRV